MDHKFKIKVNEAIEFNLDASDLSSIDILALDDSKFHVISSDKSFKAQLINADYLSKSYKVKVNSNEYNIKIFNDLDNIISEMGFSLNASKKINNIVAPMPGLILDILIKAGQEVKENDALLILEAMKMENVITSPRVGIIKSVSATKGDAVEKSQILIEYE